jgi:hypothetical protein
MSISCQVGWCPSILRTFTFHAFNSLATMTIDQITWCWNTKVIQSINQIHSHNPSHAHQLHISQPDIAPHSNVHCMMPSGEACNHPAMLTLRIFNTSTCKNGNPITNFCEMVLKLRVCGSQTNQSINQIHSHNSLHSHQLHISQSNIAPRSNVHCLMRSGEVCEYPAMHLQEFLESRETSSINQSNSLTRSFAFTSAPHFSIKYCTTFKCPLDDAEWRSVSPTYNTHSTQLL